MKSLNDKLDEIEKRADAATEGPWSNGKYRIHDIDVDFFQLTVPDLGMPENINFIAHSRKDIPLLLKALKLAVGTLEQYKNIEFEYIVSGGSFNPKLMSFNMETIHGEVFNPAKSALTEINQIFETGEKS